MLPQYWKRTLGIIFMFSGFVMMLYFKDHVLMTSWKTRKKQEQLWHHKKLHKQYKKAYKKLKNSKHRWKGS